MKKANRASLAMGVSAALGLAAMSSGAAAQFSDPQACEEYAWATCGSYYPCWWQAYNSCMYGGRSPIVNDADGVDRRSEEDAARPR